MDPHDSWTHTPAMHRAESLCHGGHGLTTSCRGNLPWKAVREREGFLSHCGRLSLQLSLSLVWDLGYYPYVMVLGRNGGVSQTRLLTKGTSASVLLPRYATIDYHNHDFCRFLS